MPAQHDEPYTQLNVRIPVALLDKLRAAAKGADVTPSQWVRRAVRERLEREAVNPG